MKDVIIFTCSILISLWTGITAWFSYYSSVTWDKPNCPHNYFNNPFIKHSCNKCRVFNIK